MIPAKDYEGRAVEEKIQMGESSNGTLQVGIDMELFEEGKSVGVMTALLYFSESAKQGSYERLKMLGWKGSSLEDIDNPAGIRTNKVPCRVTAPEPYLDKGTNEKKMGVSKLEILIGPGTLVMAKPLDAATFKARLRALGGGGGSAPAAGGGTPPPF